MTWRWRKQIPQWIRLFGRKVSDWEDGEDSSGRLGGSRSLKFRHGDR